MSVPLNVCVKGLIGTVGVLRENTSKIPKKKNFTGCLAKSSFDSLTKMLSISRTFPLS